MPRDLFTLIRAGACATLVTASFFLTPARGDEAKPAPLHERIDTLVGGAATAPLAPVASDADFLRRAYLDLTGTIPDAATARAFLDDENPNKRAELVDRLLGSPRFARHMQHTFDVMWLERRRGRLPGKGISDAEWEKYLYESFAEGKPLDQLIREILAADGSDPKLRPAVKFYLDREAEPNLLARDVGRLFFGHDLQCAQCHDHPLVDDYLQAEYYGLMAFFNRGSVFTDAKDEKKLYYAELAEGEVKFLSVFTGNARERVLPELPDGDPVDEPQLSADEQYVVKPDKNVRPVPKYSRRAQLAALACDSEQFNRNLANRLWAHMLGRGIVHPLDMLHSDNPPVNAELLEVLSAELVRMKYDVRAFFREVALSRTYQRASIEPDPNGPVVDPGAVSPLLTEWQQESVRVMDEIARLEEAVDAATTAQSEAYDAFTTVSESAAAIEKERAEAKKASDELAAALATAIKDVETNEDLHKSLAAASGPAAAAAKKLPKDKALADAAAVFQTRTAEIEKALATARATVAEKQPQVQAASLKLAELDKKLKAAEAEVTGKSEALAAAEAAADEAHAAHRAAKTQHNELAARIAAAERAVEYQSLRKAADDSRAAAQAANEQLASLGGQSAVTAGALQIARTAAEAAVAKAEADSAAAEKTWDELVTDATERFALAPLKPLTPEQLTWATMQALGLVEAQQQAQAEAAKKQAEAAGEMSDEERARLEAKALEQLVDAKLTGNIKQFVPLFGQEAGQAAGFQATVHQALFLANGGLLAGWLNPSDTNLTGRLAKIEDPAALAEEMYLAVFTRRPTADETAAVSEFCSAAGDDRPAAVRDMVWSLVTSSEFRFSR